MWEDVGQGVSESVGGWGGFLVGQLMKVYTRVVGGVE